MLATNGLVEIGRGLREAFNMGWQTFWALVLGFLIAGFLQQFVPRQRIERLLGNHGPAAATRAAAFGVVSSSCSYAASALARRLFQLGADLIASLIFMVASTNLVIELGIVLGVLIGWQFVVGEFIGGAAMVVIMASIGGLFISARTISRAREVPENQLTRDESEQEGTADNRLVARVQGALSFAISDLAMLKKEIVGGLIAAGLLAKVIPDSWWTTIFLHGHGSVATVENALVGPIVAMIACVCSVGNVPLAATLWNEGIGFAGVIAFIFADLLAFPLLLTYRRYYGTRLTLRIAALLYVSMVVAALITQALFSAIGIAPQSHHLKIFSTNANLGITTILDFVFLVLLVLAYLAHRKSRDNEQQARFAIDPICKMRVPKDDAPATVERGGTIYYFCSDSCANHFSNTTTSNVS